MTGNKSAIIHVSAINAVAQYVSPFRRNRQAGFLAPAQESPTETFEHEPIEFRRSGQERHQRISSPRPLHPTCMQTVPTARIPAPRRAYVALKERPPDCLPVTHPPDSDHDEHAGMRKACGEGSVRATTDSIGPDSSLRPLAPEGPEQRGMHQDQNPGEGAHRHGR